MQDDGEKDDPAQPVGDQEAGGDRDAVEERVDHQPSSTVVLL